MPPRAISPEQRATTPTARGATPRSSLYFLRGDSLNVVLGCVFAYPGVTNFPVLASWYWPPPLPDEPLDELLPAILHLLSV
jgi:hypothetical protein